MAADSNNRDKDSVDFEVEVLEARLADDNTSEADRNFFEKQLSFYKN